MHFRILNMMAFIGFLTAPECTEFVFGRPGPRWGIADPLAGLTEGEVRENGRRKGREEDRIVLIPSICILCVRHCT